MELGLECIGDDTYQAFRQMERDPLSRGYLSGAWGADKWRRPPRPWVADVTDGSHVFLRDRRDYSQANSVGSRGVYAWYSLTPGRVYRIHKITSWTRSETYYATVIDGDIVELTEDEAETCQNDPSAFQSLRQRRSASHGPLTGPTKST